VKAIITTATIIICAAVEGLSMKPVLFGEQDAVRESVYGNEGMKVIEP
jgi:hypothetical protein|tara:strand:+ start:1765 stop:1908 length:144 start_codon:yes stop_codon:yes gene_type:complete